MEQTPSSRPTPRLSDAAKIAACWFAAVAMFSVIMGACLAADITPGYTFTSGEKNITHTKLNDSASGTINTTFITGKTAQTPVAADSIIYYANAELAFRKTTLTTLFGNAPAINGLSTINSVGDFSVNTSKFTVSATTGNTAVGGNLTVATNLTVSGAASFYGTEAATLLGVTNLSANANATTLVVNGQTGTTGNALKVYGGATVSGASVFSNSVTFYQNTTISGNSTVSGNMTLGDSSGDTLTLNGTLAGTLRGTPTVTLTAKSSPATADVLLIGDSADSGKLKGLTLSSLVAKTNFAAASFPAPGAAVTWTHSLGGVPQSLRLVLVCTNADALGYAVGDEVSVESGTATTGSYMPLFSVRASSTNVVALLNSSGTAQLMTKTNGNIGTMTKTNWNLKGYAVYYP